MSNLDILNNDVKRFSIEIEKFLNENNYLNKVESKILQSKMFNYKNIDFRIIIMVSNYPESPINIRCLIKNEKFSFIENHLYPSRFEPRISMKKSEFNTLESNLNIIYKDIIKLIDDILFDMKNKCRKEYEYEIYRHNKKLESFNKISEYMGDLS